ncbi:unnamed protein product, partial [Lymnaea stagnalis]
TLANATSPPPVVQLFISDYVYRVLVEFFSVLCSVVSFSGCLGNGIAVRTFVLMGLKDGVTVSFLFLTASDLAYLLVLFAHSISLGFFAVERGSDFKTWFPVDPFGVYVFLSDTAMMLYLITILTTTFLAVVRCMCVAMPLKFKTSFRRATSLVILAAFVVVAVGSYTPVLVYMKMVTVFDVRVNATRSVLWISPKRDEVKDIVWITRDAFVTMATQFVIIVCVLVMARSLRAASRFRHESVMHTGTKTKAKSVTNEQVYNKTNDRSRSGSKTNPNAMTRKEFAVVQQVVLISVVYIVCNTPKITINMAALFVPDFAIGKIYQNVYLTVLGAMELFQAINSGINVIIYYKYNTKFRKNCKLCGR